MRNIKILKKEIMKESKELYQILSKNLNKYSFKMKKIL